MIYSFEPIVDCGFKAVPLFRAHDKRASIWDHGVFKRQVLQAALDANFDPKTDQWLVGEETVPEVLALNALLTRYSSINCLLYDDVEDKFKERTLGHG